MNILVTARLDDYKLATHIMGLIDSSKIERIYVIRRRPLIGFTKVININPTGTPARSRLLFEIWRIVAVLRIVRAEQIDLLVGIQLQLHGVQAAFAGWLTGIPVVQVLIGSDVHIHLQKIWKRPFLSWALRQAAGITVMGPGSRQRLVEAGLSHIHTVEMQVYQDSDRFSPNKSRTRWDLVFIGRLIPLKRVHTLLAAVSIARQYLPDIRVAIVGDGPEQVRLQKIAQTLSIAENVQFMGYDPNVEKYLSASRAFVLPSDSEGLPSAAIEAMYCGLPAIISDVGDVRGLFVPDYNALIVPKGDELALANAFIRLLDDCQYYQRLRNGALRTRDRHIAKWSRDGCVREWELLIEYCLSEKHLKAT